MIEYSFFFLERCIDIDNEIVFFLKVFLYIKYKELIYFYIAEDILTEIVKYVFKY